MRDDDVEWSRRGKRLALSRTSCFRARAFAVVARQLFYRASDQQYNPSGRPLIMRRQNRRFLVFHVTAKPDSRVLGDQRNGNSIYFGRR